MKNIYLALLSLVLIASCQHIPKHIKPIPVILISIDGFRWDYPEKHQTPNILAIAKNGVRAEQLRPAYPTKTFPNHLTLATGLYPTKHGIVDNNFCDKKRQECYAIGSGKKDSTWINGVPIWNLVELNGLRAAAYFWPESDARINGMTPSYFYHYSHNSSNERRIDQVIDWLKLPENVRPDFITTYFSEVDSIGHMFGPESQETKNAAQMIDKLIGKLRQAIREELDTDVNLIIVADHGMAPNSPEHAIDYRELPITSDFKVVNSSTRLQIYANEGVSQEAINEQKQILSNDPRFILLSDDDLAERHYTNSPRIADITAETTAPAFFTDKDITPDGHYSGNHGYTYTQDMGALFVAEGPAFKQGAMLPAFDNIHVYPLIAHILGLTPPANIDGNLEQITAALK